MAVRGIRQPGKGIIGSLSKNGKPKYLSDAEFQTLIHNAAGTGLPGGGGGSTGTVTSVSMTGDGTVYNATVPGSPITSSGTLAPTLHTQPTKTALMGPTSGADAAPTFRQPADADLSLTDITTNNVSTSAHGFQKKLPNNASLYADGTGNYSTPAGTGGYNPGTIPTVVQSAFSHAGGNSAVFGVAPTNGNLLVAHCYNPASNTAGTGWTKQTNVSTGTDFGVILTKVAGAGESTTQTPLSGVGATGCMVIWELHGQAGSNFYAYGSSEAEGADFSNIAQTFNASGQILLPNLTNMIGLASVGIVAVAGLPVFLRVNNFGTQDVLDNAGTTRQIAAGHTDLAQTPFAGLLGSWATSTNYKCCTCLITS